MQHPHARPTAPLPGNWKDAARLSESELQAATGPILETWQAVWVRKAGWHPGILTGWRLCGPGRWAARVQWGPGPDETAWLRYKAVALRPMDTPGDDPGRLAEDHR